MSKKFQKIVNQSEETEISIPDKEKITDSNNTKIRNVEPVLWNLAETTDLSTDYIIADLFEEDDEIGYIYKEWKIEIVSHLSLSEKITIILPYIHYNIIYKEPVENNIGYSRSHEDMQSTYFFEIREELLYLHVGFCIKNDFNAEDLITVPEVKLRVALRNSLRINQ